MNWRITGTVLLVIGALVATGGLIWRTSLQSDANNCGIRNFGKAFPSDCPSTTPGLIVAIVGLGIVAVAVALLTGVSGHSEDNGQPWGPPTAP